MSGFAVRSSGRLGKDQRVDALTALEAITTHGAYLYKEEAIQGSIEKGKLADVVLFDKNPLKVRPEELTPIHVLETMKEGVTVFAKARQKAGADRPH